MLAQRAQHLCHRHRHNLVISTCIDVQCEKTNLDHPQQESRLLVKLRREHRLANLKQHHPQPLQLTTTRHSKGKAQIRTSKRIDKRQG